MVKKRVYKACIASCIALSMSVAYAKEESKEEKDLSVQSSFDMKQFFGFYGAMGAFSRFGFNQDYNPNEGVYPTDSVATLYIEANTSYDFLQFMQGSEIDSLKFTLGGAVGGLAYDSTIKDNGGLGYWYAGYYGGYLGEIAASPTSVHNYVLHNANLDFKMNGFYVKLGRYKSWMDQQSAYTQGFNVDYTFDFSNDMSLKAWAFGSYGRAYAYAQWIYDWYSELTTDTNNDGKADANLGKYAFGVDFKQSIQTDSMRHDILIRPYIYFYPGIFEAYGGRAIYEGALNDISIKGQIQGYYLHIHDKHVIGKTNNQSIVDSNSVNLNAVLEATYHGYNAGVGYYQNIGSANAYFGGYPIYIDIWTASIYDIGRSKSDMVNRNAISGYIFASKGFANALGNSSAKILGRYTNSPRSDEISLALLLGHTFKNNLSLGFKIEYFSDTTKAGYAIHTTTLNKTRTDDRSHVFVTLDYGF